MRTALATTILLVALNLPAEEPPSLVDYPGFVGLSAAAQAYRQQRLVELDRFLRLAAEPGAIILDTRSQRAFAEKHLKGAVHLNFSDFAAEKLAQVIPNRETRILIYCNNNISGDRVSFMTKSPPLALNIPTFINLYGYGYRNLYELSTLVAADDDRVTFEGTRVK